MTVNTREVLCVGGKHDGRRGKISDDPTIVTVMFPDSLFEYSVYQIEALQVGDRVFWIGRPAEQSLEDTVAILLAGYSPVEEIPIERRYACSSPTTPLPPEGETYEEYLRRTGGTP